MPVHHKITAFLPLFFSVDQTHICFSLSLQTLKPSTLSSFSNFHNFFMQLILFQNTSSIYSGVVSRQTTSTFILIFLCQEIALHVLSIYFLNAAPFTFLFKFFINFSAYFPYTFYIPTPESYLKLVVSCTPCPFKGYQGLGAICIFLS